MAKIVQQDIQQLLVYFSQNMYSANDSNADDIMNRCEALLRLDYSVVDIPNTNGMLSTNYPVKLLIPERELKRENPFESNVTGAYGEHHTDNSRNGGSSNSKASPPNRDQVIINGKIDAQRLGRMMHKARFARCRSRFPLPVILYNGKYVCRSSTLAGGAELHSRFLSQDTNRENESSADEADSQDWLQFGRQRKRDIRLLKALNVETIVDLMVEKKKVKYGLYVTSSEKVDKEDRYSLFKIIGLPYPGCEFFLEYRNNNCQGEGLVFDWTQSFVDAEIQVPENSFTTQLNIDWDQYKEWDLVKITQNYLRLCIKYLHENKAGILVHCISGWDRTPLFISMIRLSLWADGEIHQSLDATQILYFTIAYDWLLCGHNLPDRIKRGELIFIFCFYILKYIHDEEYSVLSHRSRSQHSSGSSSIDIIRTDSDSVTDGLLLDGESRGSNFSLNSESSFASGRSSVMHDTQTIDGTSNSIAITNRIGSGNNGSIYGFSDDSVNSFNGNNSVHSNGSSSSSIECISQDSSNHNNQWSPPQPTRTSPVTVPCESRVRQRHESTSSVGSWQMITGTGSLRSIDSVSEMHSHLHHYPGYNCPNHSHYQQQNHSLNAGQSGDGSISGPSSSNASTPNANQYDNCCRIINGVRYPNKDVHSIRRIRLEELRVMFYNCYFSTIGFPGPDQSLGSMLGHFAEKVGLTGGRPSA